MRVQPERPCLPFTIKRDEEDGETERVSERAKGSECARERQRERRIPCTGTGHVRTSLPKHPRGPCSLAESSPPVCVCVQVCVCVCVCVSALALASKLTHTHETHLHPSTHTRLINFCATIVPARYADGHSDSQRDRHRERLTDRHTETLVERTRKHFGPILLNPALSAPLPSALPPSISIAFSVSASEHHQVGEEST